MSANEENAPPVAPLPEEPDRNRKPDISRCVFWFAALGFVVIMASIVIPNFIGVRFTSAQNACINNLRLIDSAKQQWALEAKKDGTDFPTEDDLRPYLGRGAAGQLPYCPGDTNQSFKTSYGINSVGVRPICRIRPIDHRLP